MRNALADQQRPAVVHGTPCYHKTLMPEANVFEPSFTVGERLKFSLIPPRWYARYLVRKNLRRGEPELRFLPQIVPRDRIAVDVGANKGVYTRVLAGIASHVHAFEPNPKAFRWLNRALPDNVTVHPLALSDRVGDGRLYVPKKGRGYSNQMASMKDEKANAPHGVIPVQTGTLDSCALTNLGFIKIDVEGYELEVLAGAQGTIKRCHPTLLIEIEQRHTVRSLGESIADIESMGYRAHFLWEQELRPFEAFDLERHHSAPTSPSDYVFNFFFLPD